MALNIKDPETERLAAEVARLTGDTKTGAIRAALRERHGAIVRRSTSDERREHLERALDELWRQVPDDLLDRPPLTREEREAILGFGPEGA
jgi:antitoxin VapB